jgi:hypothetical protein
MACLARSSSKPHSIDSSPACSSATTMERSVCGRDRAASAIIAASRASVLASPGVQVRDAPHGQTGQVADHNALCLGHGDRQGADGRGLVDDQQDLCPLRP